MIFNKLRNFCSGKSSVNKGNKRSPARYWQALAGSPCRVCADGTTA